MTILLLILTLAAIWLTIVAILVCVPSVMLAWSLMFEKHNDKLKTIASKYRSRHGLLAGNLGYVMVYGKIALNKKNRKLTGSLIGIICAAIGIIIWWTSDKALLLLFIILVLIEALMVACFIRSLRNYK